MLSETSEVELKKYLKFKISGSDSSLLKIKESCLKMGLFFNECTSDLSNGIDEKEVRKKVSFLNKSEGNDILLYDTISHVFNESRRVFKHRREVKPLESFILYFRRVSNKISYPSSYPGVLKVQLKGIDPIQVFLKKPIEGKIKSFIFRLSNKSKLEILFCVSYKSKKTKISKNVEKSSVGVDLGIKTTAFLSTGESFNGMDKSIDYMDTINFHREKLKRCVKGSKRYEKIFNLITKKYQKMRRYKKSESYRIAKSIVSRGDFIFIEKLDLKGLMKNNSYKFNSNLKPISYLMKFIKQKCIEEGKIFGCVNPQYTSQVCSSCNLFLFKNLKERMHRCSCGLSINRDLNAAINIKKLGVYGIKQQKINVSGEYDLSKYYLSFRKGKKENDFLSQEKLGILKIKLENIKNYEKSFNSEIF